MKSWILTDKTEKIVASRDADLGIDEKVIVKAMSTIVGQSGRVDVIGQIDLPNSKMFYKQISNEYCLFVVTQKSIELDRIKPAFVVISMSAVEEKMTIEKLHSRINTTLSDIKTKVLIMGYAGVGKTTIRNLLRGKTIPLVHNPTIGVEVIQLSDEAILWDTAGQTGFIKLLPTYLRGSDLVVVVADSSLENSLQTKTLVESLRPETNAHFVLIANKQDQPDALNPARVAQIVGVREFMGLTALDQHQRQTVINFINKGLGL